MQQGSCPKCGSRDVIPNVYVMDLGHANYPHNLKVSVEEHPNAWLFKGEVRSSLKAWVCGACGFTELYAKNPRGLLVAYRKQMEEQS
jgi:hypothetical protein